MAFYSAEMSAAFDSDRFKVLFGTVPPQQLRGVFGFSGEPGSPKISIVVLKCSSVRRVLLKCQ